jgi:hypothetical protein
MLSFKDFMIVDYQPGMPELIKYKAHKRHRGVVGEASYHAAKDMRRKVQDKIKPEFHDKYDFNKIKTAQAMLNMLNRAKSLNHLKEDVDIEEALTFAARRKKARDMQKYKSRIAIGRKKAERRTANLDTLKKRARKQARAMFFNKLSKGAPKDDVSFARRQEIEKRLDKLKPRIDRVAKKLIKKARQDELERKRSKQAPSQ